jgi:hypothetical protein
MKGQPFCCLPIVFLAILKTSFDWVYGLVGLLAFGNPFDAWHPTLQADA